MFKTVTLKTLFAVAALVLMASPARATLYNGSYTVTSNNNPATGLAVMTINDFGAATANPNTNTFTGLNVAPLVPHFVDLFELFALEPSPYSGNDLVPQPISVTFNFTSPSALSGTISGTTAGILGDDALLHWLAPINLNFPTGKLTITLLDAPFSDFFNGVVTAVFVPEPGTGLLMLLSLAGVVHSRQRRHRG